MKNAAHNSTAKLVVFRFATKAEAEKGHSIIYWALRTIMHEDGLTLEQIRSAMKRSLPKRIR